MDYVITQDFAHDSPVLTIHKDEYYSLVSARESMFVILNLAEKFSYLIDNYYELESDLLADDLRQMHYVDHIPRRDDTLDSIHLLIRRITNVLATARLYIDHTRQDLKRVSTNGDELAKEFRQQLCDAYDDSFGYRLCEALRNYIQHCAIPVRGISRPYNVIDRNAEEWQYAHYVAIRLDKVQLTNETNLKSTVRQEISELEEDVDFRLCLREYVSKIAKTHEWLLECVAPIIQSDTALIDAAVERYKMHANESDVRHVILKLDKSVIGMSTTAADRFDWLSRQQSGVSAISSHFVASLPIHEQPYPPTG